MLNPIRLVNDLFDTKELSDTKLEAYTADHLIRLANNNPSNIYDVMITDTTNKYQAYYGNLVSEATKTAVREGLSQSMNVAYQALLNKISNIGKLADYLFENNPAKYQQFFPQGVTEYYEATLSNIVPLLDRLETAANTNLLPQYTADVTQLSDLILAFKSARNAQLNAFSEEQNTSTDRRETRKQLTMQLTANLLIIASNNIGNADNFDNYYNRQLLPISNNAPDNETLIDQFEGTIAPSTTINLGALPNGAFRIQLVVVNGGPLEIGLSTDGTTFNGNTVTQGGIGETTILISDLNSAGTQLILRNQNNNVEGTYIVRILE